MTARRGAAIAGAVVTATLLTVLATPRHAETAASGDSVRERPRGVVADCSKGSGAPQGSLSVFRSRGNLVVGPLVMSGAARVPGYYSAEFGGNKFPLFLRAGHRVTVAVAAEARGQAGLAYGPLPQGTVSLREAHRVITFIACRRGQFSPGLGAKAGRLSFWAGGVVARGPRCVPLLVWVDDEPSPRRAVVHLGVRDCAAPAPTEQPVPCTAQEVETVTRRFISSSNAGALGELDDLFAQEPEFEWYSTDGPGERLTPAANDRSSLVSYFRDRHALSERLELGSFTFNGNTRGSRVYGNFQYTLTRSADDLAPTVYAGKGASLCYRKRSEAIFVWSMGRQSTRSFASATAHPHGGQFAPSGGARCDVAAVRTALTAFVRAYKRGDFARLDRLFSREPRFVWYSWGRSARSDRAALIPNLRRRYLRGDRLRSLTFRFNGYERERGYGHFELDAERRADDLLDGGWFPMVGKGVLDCMRPPVTIALLFLGGR